MGRHWDADCTDLPRKEPALMASLRRWPPLRHFRWGSVVCVYFTDAAQSIKKFDLQ